MTTALAADPHAQVTSSPVPASPPPLLAGGPALAPITWRFELKYVVPAVDRAALRADLGALTQPDRHGLRGCYRVRSLYFDSRDWACYYDKLAGLGARRKLRVRVYPDPQDAVCLVSFEVKRRVGTRTGKTTVHLPLAECGALLDGLAGPGSLLTGASTAPCPGMTAFLACRQRFSLRPIALMAYDREAMRLRGDARVRITLDERLTVAPARHVLDDRVAFQPVIPPHTTFLEVKFPQHMPRSVLMLVKKYHLRLQSISKYCLAVTAGPFGLNGLLHA